MGIAEALTKVAVKWGQSASKFLPDVCTIKRNQASGGSATLGTIHTSVPCSVIPMGSGGGGQPIRAKAAYKITMPAAINGTTLNTVKVEDLLVVTARGLQPSRTFKVQSVEQEKGVKVVVRGTIEA